MNWEMIETPIDGCFLIKNKSFSDLRGAFSETYKKSAFLELGLPEMVQDNHLITKMGGIRAMHWQETPFSQAKLIHVVCGRIFDAVYDLRKNSPTLNTFATFDLDENSPLLFVPAGCAHGFQGISELSVVHYKTDKEYNFESQRAFLWNDPEISIPWPLIHTALVSEKDALAPRLSDIDA
jgi:dTDP-4-dehydrorhamnose 3,5-epimerase